jgi:trans-aconitate 2-methyltransferase
MPSWNADLYLKFAADRTRPASDLARRVAIDDPRHVIDLGCGPGNSLQALAQRWPRAALTGLDNSAEMIAAAGRAYPDRRWVAADIADWAAGAGDPYDVVYSNAAMQWLPDHATLYPAMFRHVAPGGALAIQVPADVDAPPHRIMRDLAASPEWRGRFPAGGVREWFVHDAGFYYDLLSPLGARLDLWRTEYTQVMDDADAIVEFYRGSGLRPFLDALTCDEDRSRFIADYGAAIRPAFPARPDGRVLFPFLRLFLIAYRPA